MTSDTEVEAMLAAGPLRTDLRRSTNSILQNVAELVAEDSRSSAVRVSTPEFSIALHRSTAGR